MKTFILLLLILFLPCVSVAKVRDLDEAIAIARQFWKMDSPGGISAVSQQKVIRIVKSNEGDVDEPGCAFYVINDTIRNRFALIASDDRMGDILGYSDRGIFDSEDAAPALLDLLASYHDCYLWIQENENISLTSDNEKYSVIEPMIKTHWGQDDPYNRDCPKIKDEACPTGCAATALAQILNYYRYMPNGLGNHSYTTYSLGIEQSMDFEDLNINWDVLDCDYDESSSSEACAEVAKLMHACGVSLSMDYRLIGSGVTGNVLGYALKKFWGYNPNIVYREWAYEGNSVDIRKKIFDELEQGRPVLADLYRLFLGHEAIIDGRDENGLLHYNFGWDGRGDGYYTLWSFAITDVDQHFYYGNYTMNVSPFLCGESSYDFTMDGYRLPEAVAIDSVVSKELKIKCVSTDVPSTLMGIDEPLVVYFGFGIFDSEMNMVHSLAGDSISFFSNMEITISLGMKLDEIPFVNGQYIGPYIKRADSEILFLRSRGDDAELYQVFVDSGYVYFSPRRYQDICTGVEEKYIEDNVAQGKVSVKVYNGQFTFLAQENTAVSLFNDKGQIVRKIRLRANVPVQIQAQKGLYVICGRKYLIP